MSITECEAKIEVALRILLAGQDVVRWVTLGFGRCLPPEPVGTSIGFLAKTTSYFVPDNQAIGGTSQNRGTHLASAGIAVTMWSQPLPGGAPWWTLEDKLKPHLSGSARLWLTA